MEINEENMIKNPIKIAIASGKGGTGKTLLSTNLAAYLSEKSRCLLADLDVEEPNDLLFFGEQNLSVTNKFKQIPKWDEAKCSLCGDCTKNCKFHAVLQLGNMVAVFNELCHSCYACSELCPSDALPMSPHLIGKVSEVQIGKLTLLESKLALTEEQSVPLINMAKRMLIDDFASNEIQVLDCPPGTSCPMVAAVKNTNYVILVTEPTPFGLNDLRLAVETIRKLKIDFGVVINRFGIGDNGVEDYCNLEEIQIIGKIAYDKQIAFHYSNGDLVYDKIEHFNNSLKEIVRNLPLMHGEYV
jgi:MinD superfamily P-loop ATPase